MGCDGNNEVDAGFESEESSGNEYESELFEPSGAAPSPSLGVAFEPIIESLADDAARQFSESALHSTPRCSDGRHLGTTAARSTPPSPLGAPPSPPRSFACPFHVHDPAAHAACLTRADELPRVIDVRRHLQAAHRRPAHCPICGLRFARAAARDDHVRGFTCAPAGARRPGGGAVLPPPGLADAQLRRLARRAPAGAPEDVQWADLWRLCFPDHEGAPPSPYAAARPGGARVAAARAFWASRGRALVAEAVGAAGAGQGGPAALTEAGLEALNMAVLERMLDKLMLDSGVGGEPTVVG